VRVARIALALAAACLVVAGLSTVQADAGDTLRHESAPRSLIVDASRACHLVLTFSIVVGPMSTPRQGPAGTGELTAQKVVTNGTTNFNWTFGYNAEGDQTSASDSVSASLETYIYDQALSRNRPFVSYFAAGMKRQHWRYKEVEICALRRTLSFGIATLGIVTGVLLFLAGIGSIVWSKGR